MERVQVGARRETRANCVFHLLAALQSREALNTTRDGRALEGNGLKGVGLSYCRRRNEYSSLVRASLRELSVICISSPVLYFHEIPPPPQNKVWPCLSVACPD